MQNRQVETRIAVGIGVLIVVVPQSDGGGAVLLGIERIAPYGLEAIDEILRRTDSAGVILVIALRPPVAPVETGVAECYIAHGIAPQLLVGVLHVHEIVRPLLLGQHLETGILGRGDRFAAGFGGKTPILLPQRVVQRTGGIEQGAAFHRQRGAAVGIPHIGRGEVSGLAGTGIAPHQPRSPVIVGGPSEILGTPDIGVVARQTGHVPLVVGPELGVDIGHSAEITAQREMGHAAGEIGAGQKVVPLCVRSILQHVDIGDRSVGDADDLEHDLHDRAITRSRCQTVRRPVRHRPGTHGPGQFAPADAGVGDTPFQRPAHG